MGDPDGQSLSSGIVQYDFVEVFSPQKRRPGRPPKDGIMSDIERRQILGRGRGRPPKDGIMSNRERREIANAEKMKEIKEATSAPQPDNWNSYEASNTQLADLTNLVLPQWEAFEDPLPWWYQNRMGLPNDPTLWLEAAALYLTAPDPRIVAFPTETVYGLGADATRSQCVRKIFWAKDRPADNPLIVHVSSTQHLERLCGKIPTQYIPLINKFWPGPLTLIMPLPESSPFAPEVSHNLKTWGVRLPVTPIARLLIALADRPLAAPSANTSKRPSTTTAGHVVEDLNRKVDIILDGGPCGLGVESTVIDGLHDPPLILRPGGVSLEQIQTIGGFWAKTRNAYDERVEENTAPRAPGMKYKHYAPKGEMLLFTGDVPDQEAKDWLQRVVESHEEASSALGSCVVGIIHTSDRWAKGLGGTRCAEVGESEEKEPDFGFDSYLPQEESSYARMETGLVVYNQKPHRVYSVLLHTPEAVAHDVFAVLRAFDELGCDVIAVEGLEETHGGISEAVMNRLKKAARADEGIDNLERWKRTFLMNHPARK